MRVLVIGLGPIGMLVASGLAKAGLRPSLLCRPAAAAAFREQGINRTGVLGSHLAGPASFDAYESLAELAGPPFDAVVVAAKAAAATELAGELSAHAERMRSDAPLVLFCNGWGVADAYARWFPHERIYAARVITGCKRGSASSVVVTVHAGDVLVGSIFNSDVATVRPLAAALTMGGVPARPAGQIGRDIWAKLAFNCVVNGIGAIWGDTPAVWSRDSGIGGIVAGITREVFTCMAAAGFQTHWPTPEEYCDEFWHRLLPATAAHSCSTLQDLQAGKRTEIDYLNGAIVALGRQYAIDTPWNLLVYRALKAIEGTRDRPQDFALVPSRAADQVHREGGR